MASYHLSVKTIKRSAGRSATAAAAYRAGAAIPCEREGRLHDYTAKQGVHETFMLLPENAPDWSRDRAHLWNAVEARETRKNSVTAREWELALPAEIGHADRRALVEDFAGELVERYGIAADVAIHAPHREGDQRNWHAHILTTTRRLEPEGLTDKTRILDAAQTGGPEIVAMRGVWAEMQNEALEWAEVDDRVDHRSLEAQSEAARAEGDDLRAEELDRPAEVKLGPAANAMERREHRDAAAEGRDYVPVTERGRVVHQACQMRDLLAELRERVERAREVYTDARDAGQDRVGAGLAALRAAMQAQRGASEGDAGRDGGEALDGRDSLRDRLRRITAREGWEKDGGGGQRPDRQAEAVREAALRARRDAILGRGEVGKTTGVGRDQPERERTKEKQKEKGRSRDDDDALEL